MTLHYRVVPDVTGVDPNFALLPPDLSVWGSVRPIVSTPLVAPHGNPAPTPVDGYCAGGKRLFDIVLASVALVLAAPVLALLALALWLESGNPFYTQLRLGRHGTQFRMIKLRTMVRDADARLAECLARDPALNAEWALTQKLKRDPRITPVGRLLRKTSLDELPQILNVLKGDMSLVGPRPMLPEQLPLYLAPAAYLRLRPGITGLWQVTARNEESFDLRAVLDQRYSKRVSLGYDLRIIGATFGAVLRGTGY